MAVVVEDKSIYLFAVYQLYLLPSVTSSPPKEPKKAWAQVAPRKAGN